MKTRAALSSMLRRTLYLQKSTPGSLAATGDVSVLAAGAAALVAMGDFVSSGGAEAQDVQAILASKSGALIDSLAGSAAQMAADSQSMQQARRAK